MTTPLGQEVLRGSVRLNGLAVPLALVLAVGTLWAQSEMEDLPRAPQIAGGGPASSQSDAGGRAGASATASTDGSVTLKQLGLPADALDQAERRLPSPEQRAATNAAAGFPAAPASFLPLEKAAVVQIAAAPQADPWAQAQQAVELVGSVLAENDSSDSRRARLEELTADIGRSLETAVPDGLAAKNKALAERLDAFKQLLDSYFATSYGKLSYFSFERYSRWWRRRGVASELREALDRLGAEVRAARAAAPAAGPAAPALAPPVLARFPSRAGAGLKEGELPTVTVRSPSGKLTRVHAFPDAGAFAVRVMAPEKGRWTATAASGDEVSFDSTSTGGKSIRIDPKSPKTFTRADGRRFTPVGMNLCWVLEGNSPQERAEGWRRYLDKMAATGQNWVRVWCCPWSMFIEGNQTGVGRYDAKAAAALDRVFELAAERGIYVQLVLEYHGMLRPKNDWSRNAYNAANGGPCQKPGEFFSSAAARRYFKRRLDYMIARYSGYENLLAWELWNEVDLTLCNPVNVLRWHEEMGAYLKQHDPAGHLVTTSTAGETVLYAPLWMQRELDYAQIHIYRRDLAKSLPGFIDNIDHYRKPSLAGEAGQDAAWEPYIWETKFDPAAIGLHDALFAGLVSGSAGTGMFWWWDKYIETSNHYGVFRPASKLATWMEAMSGDIGKASVSVSGSKVRGLGLHAPGRVLVWLKDEDYVPTEKVPTPSAVTRGAARVKVEVPAEGSWELTRFDTWTGEQKPAGTVTAHGRKLEFEAASFSRDVAYLGIQR
ncbi:MAG: cellulase family glycosylhydrolase [Candidatus Wallbacteria bacterium]|nr:cellulase family glycosylhydrolase [Candidatus Wallbacteria bacterium]